ncbi:MAG: thioether cross-link-forming SCIFF peptide maturase [Firmicutes bacterium]|nr:thioether cross-link-forming SCIFF peptide maturase [Bacillota bacterium]
MVHTFALHDLKLALDVESGALHILDDAAFCAVRLLAAGIGRQEVHAKLQAEYGKQTASQVMAEIEAAEEQGLLFSVSRRVDLATDGAVKALCLHLAHDCNLRCKYCFAGTGNYGGARGLMPLDVAKAAVDFLLQAAAGRKHLEIDFFGGEPLLNFPVLKETVAYGRQKAEARGKKLKFTVTTNAYNVPEEVKDYLNREEISIVLSLDGRREVHDRMRVTPAGRGSWESVLQNCRQIVAGRGGDNYYLRGTYTRHNLDFCQDVKEMVGHGFRLLSLEPAVLSPAAEEALQEEDLPVIFAEYEKLAALLWEWEEAGQKVYFFHFELDLHQGPCAKKRLLGCGAGSSYLAVTPDGKLYPCHQFAGEADFCVGNVKEGITAPEIRRRFAAVDSAAKAECAVCFARYFCGGGCHAAAWHQNRDLARPYALGCKLHRKRVECGLYLQAKRMLAKTGR